MGWDTYSFPLIGSLELSKGYLLFDTDTAQLSGDMTLNGTIAKTRNGTLVTVFNFLTVYLGPDVRVRFKGHNAIAILSRSSMLINTDMKVRPGTLGGFPGGGYVGYDATNNNRNGPGSSNVRVYVETLSTYATHVPEVQEIETIVGEGQRLGGYFRLLDHTSSLSTSRIDYDTNAETLEHILETAFSNIGQIHVHQEREEGEIWSEVGRLWRITFLTAVGNVPQLQVESKLTGIGADVLTRTIREGNQLGGTFQLQFLNKITRPLAHDVSAHDLRSALLQDFPFLVDAKATRTDPLSSCNQGSTLPDQRAVSTMSILQDALLYPSNWTTPSKQLVYDPESLKRYQDRVCSNGRGGADGYVWKLQLWTRVGSKSSTSPKADAYGQIDAVEELRVVDSGLSGEGALAEVVHSGAFTLSFGGGGASFTNTGGNGYIHAQMDVREIYADRYISDLIAGSGGSGGGTEPLDMYPLLQPPLGGAGAGAMLLSAVNDVVIGSHGRIQVNGGNGMSSANAGGGGSGGTILIVSQGTVSHHGSIQAVGGHGGTSSLPSTSTSHRYAGGGGSGGRIAIYAQSYSAWGEGTLELNGGSSQDLSQSGGRGTLYIHVQTNLAYRVDPTIGAAGTFKSLLVSGAESYQYGKEGSLDGMNQMSLNGPRYRIDNDTHRRPTRISYFVRIGNFDHGNIGSNRGALFGVHRGYDDADKEGEELLVGIAIVNGNFVYESNTFGWPRRVFQRKIEPKRWYKVDVYLNWDLHHYSIYLNDVLKVYQTRFDGEQVSAISLNNFHPMSIWWDEIYVGESFLMNFVCPSVSLFPSSIETLDETLRVPYRRLRKLWKENTYGPETSFHPMSKHESHLSQQEVYQYDTSGQVAFDGEEHYAFLNDIKEFEEEIESDDDQSEAVTRAEMMFVDNFPSDATIVIPLETGMDYTTLNADRSYNTKTAYTQLNRSRIYWYSEVYNETLGIGGVGACSTMDYQDWRNEGIMLHFDNLTDPFGDVLSHTLVADRPKAIYNPKTKKFVLWFHVDTIENTIGLAGVATSKLPNGPFRFQRSMYPTAPLESPGGQSINETRDQTIALVPLHHPSKDIPSTAYLIRTYFKTVEYWLPRPVMDPLWESVKAADGSIDFSLNYHRAVHHEGYDDPDDIYLQRWRMEGVPWAVVCCAITNLTDCLTITEVPNATHPNVCPDDHSKKMKILGQAQTASQASTRYLDPNDPYNSIYRPNSVPSYTTWGAQVYKVKTWRGTYFDALSTNITKYVFDRYASERRRIQVANDPTIPYEYFDPSPPTFIPTNDVEILDLMFGNLGVPITSEFQAAHSSPDLAEIDPNEDGKITSYEVAMLEKKLENKELAKHVVEALLYDFEKMKWNQIHALDVNNDGEITFSEFEAWVGMDPNLLFDQYDLDKNGYLDENELSRFLWDRQLPRIDTAIILLDPSFDGRVYYSRFLAIVRDFPDFIYRQYDFDNSETLTQDEIDLIAKDLGAPFAIPGKLEALKDASIHAIHKEDYKRWFSATTSLLAGERNYLKVDNAVHATKPDSLVGPMQVVERRRAKYVGISRLSEDYLDVEKVIEEIEGDFEGGRDDLLQYFAFAQDLFGLTELSVVSLGADDNLIQDYGHTYRQSLSPSDLHNRASYWNGRYWEGRPAAPALFTYGSQCLHVAGVDAEDLGCLPCLTRSPYVTSTIEEYESVSRGTGHCDGYKELDAYLKQFDQQVAIQLQYQQSSRFGPQGLQPHYSPCWNQSQFYPCDVHKVLEGDIGGSLSDNLVTTEYNLAWQRHPNSIGSSQKIRAGDGQKESIGPSFRERFPSRNRAMGDEETLDTTVVYQPDQYEDSLGGGT